MLKFWVEDLIDDPLVSKWNYKPQIQSIKRLGTLSLSNVPL